MAENSDNYIDTLRFESSDFEIILAAASVFRPPYLVFWIQDQRCGRM
jgi:hypothetical protein